MRLKKNIYIYLNNTPIYAAICEKKMPFFITAIGHRSAARLTISKMLKMMTKKIILFWKNVPG